MNSNKVVNFFKDNILILFIIFLCVVISILKPLFLTPDNLLNVLMQISINALLATGMTFAILTGGIDLSVGSVAAFSGIATTAIVRNFSESTPVIVMVLVVFGVALCVGLVCGGISGWAVSRLNMPPFIATLAMTNVARGAGFVYTQSRSIYGLPTNFSWLGIGSVGFIPTLGLLAIIVLVLAYIVLTKTVFGRYVYAVGSNEEVAKLSGVRTENIKLFAHIICSTLAALGGGCLASRLMTGQPSAANGYELNAIAAVAMGGTSMSGGSGGIGKTVLGILTIGIINNSLSLMQVDSYWQTISLGVIIFLAVTFDLMKTRKANKK